MSWLTLNIPLIQPDKLAGLGQKLGVERNHGSHRVGNFLQLQELDMDSGWELRDGYPFSILSAIAAPNLRKGPILSQGLYRMHADLSAYAYTYRLLQIYI